jgi:hypothetical protein
MYSIIQPQSPQYIPIISKLAIIAFLAVDWLVLRCYDLRLLAGVTALLTAQPPARVSYFLLFTFYFSWCVVYHMI